MRALRSVAAKLAAPVPSLLLLVLFAPLLLGAGGGDDEIVKEFKKYFRKYKDTATRVEAVMALQGVESATVVDALVPVLKDEDLDVARAAIQVLAAFGDEEPRARIWEVLEANKDEGVRAGLLQAIANGGYPGDPEVLLELLDDRSWIVRRKTIGAVSRARMDGAAEAILPLCQDKEVAVRCAALEGLAHLRSELVLAPAIEELENSTWQVRASAVHALGKVRHGSSIGPLIHRMTVEEGRLVKDIGEALAEITGRDFGLRIDGWLRFWETYGESFVIPTDAELAKLREAQKARRDEYKPPGAVTYHGIETPSRSILFVIDVSGSMENLVVEKDRFKDGDYPSFQRIDVVKTELRRTIENLESYVKFNVLAFATEVKSWKRDLVSANVLNKSSADDWIRKLEAIGGSSKEDLARHGLTTSANLAAGKTNTFGALMEALGAAGRGAVDKNYEVAVDTIFFLSDGRPSTGKYVDTTDILREVNAANDLRKVVIHTIALGEFQKDFMRRLAEENGGVFVDLGR
jgi:hypothetical protein